MQIKKYKLKSHPPNNVKVDPREVLQFVNDEEKKEFVQIFNEYTTKQTIKPLSIRQVNGGPIILTVEY